MKIQRLTLPDMTPQIWDGLTGDRVFASSGFASLWRTKGGTPAAWAAIAGGDGAVLAMVPGVEFGPRGLRRFMSMPDGCYGGLVDALPDGRDRNRIADRILAAISGHRYLRTWLFDFYDSLPADEAFRHRQEITTLVDISSPDWQPVDGKLMSQIRKAEREGIRVEKFDWARHRHGFLSLLRSTAARQGVPVRLPPRFYEELALLAEHDERVHWLMCEHDGEPACSHIYVVDGGRLQGWQIVFDKAFSFLKPNQYMRYTVCRDMVGRGIRELNLGGTPDDAPGLKAYKNRWGGNVHRYPAYVRPSLLGRLLQRPKRDRP